MTPQVSIVIPAYNRAHLIESALRSVTAQTFADWECIVADDASTDDLANVVSQWADRDARFRYVRLPTNRGAQAARNAAIRIAQGEWIAFLDSDDELVPESLAWRLEVARMRRVAFVHAAYYKRMHRDQEPRPEPIPVVEGWVYRRLLCGPGPGFPSILVRKHALERIGLLDETIRAWQEWETSLRLARHFELAYDPRPTFIWNCAHDGNLSKSSKSAAMGFSQIIRKHAWAILWGAGPRQLASHLLHAAQLCQEAGEMTRARRLRLIGKLLWPWAWRPW